jgi:hypothetical protein
LFNKNIILYKILEWVCLGWLPFRREIYEFEEGGLIISSRYYII